MKASCLKYFGKKWQKYDKATDKIITLRGTVNTEKGLGVKLLTEKGGCVAKTTRTLRDEYVEIRPDALMNILVTDSEDIEGGADIYICLHKIDQLAEGNQVPSVIIRQNVIDDEDTGKPEQVVATLRIGGAAFDPFNEGKCKEFMALKEVDACYSMYLYVDDTLDTICKIIEVCDVNDELTKAFNHIRNKLGLAADIVEGLCSNIRELMTTQHFMYYFRAMFNITQVDWPVEFSQTKYEGDTIKFNNKQTQKLAELLDMNPDQLHNAFALRYEKDIDISKIVSYKHILISDSTEKIYLVVYG